MAVALSTFCLCILVYAIILSMDRRLNYVETAWSAPLAYVVGLIASDGNVSSDGRHINITSKDLELVSHVKEVLNLANVIGRKARGGSPDKKYYVLQFGSKNFYAFLLSIGLTPAKSKTIARVEVPNTFFSDFLRGCVDGDGSIVETKHPESKHPQLRLILASASKPFLEWTLSVTRAGFGVQGGSISKCAYKSAYLLRFGKSDSIVLLRAMYAKPESPALTRKRVIALKYLGE
jgi:hypothetical protein